MVLPDVGHRSLLYKKLYLKHVVPTAFLWLLGNGHFYVQKLQDLSLQKAFSGSLGMITFISRSFILYTKAFIPKGVLFDVWE